MSVELVAMVGGILATVIGAVLAAVMHYAKKTGQKTAEAEYEQQAARDAKATGQVMAQHRTADDAARRLSDGSF